MRNFLKTFFSSCLGTLFAISLLSGLGTLALVGLLAVLFQEASKVDQFPQPSEGTILHLSFKGGLVETLSEDPLDQIDIENLSLLNRRTLDHVLLGIRDGASDERIKGIFLDLQGTPGNWSQMNEIRNAIIKFRSSGKWVYAYGQSLTPSFYHLASASNTIAMDPVGQLPLKGMGIEMLFFGRMLKEWGIEPRAVRARNNTFKSAIEPFTLDRLSDENKIQLDSLIQQRWQFFSHHVETSRGLAPGSIESYTKNLQPAEPEAAKELGLVDELLYEDQVKKKLIDRVEGGRDDGTSHWMSVSDYARSQELLISLESEGHGEGIGLIIAEGAIMNQAGPTAEIIYPKRLKSRLKEMAEDDRISSLVLRINSPGGSAQASEWLWRAIRNFSHSKPVVVSLGPMAASGGYYMASAGNLIVTDPLTLTGSIGVFGLMPRLDKALEEHLDITVDRVHTHPNLATSLLGPISGPAMTLIQNQVDDIYRLFIDRVSRGRNLSTEEVENLARGRVWSGLDAVKKGLADHQGGLLKAIELAQDQGGLSNYSPIYTSQPGDLLEVITKRLEERLDVSHSPKPFVLPFSRKGVHPQKLKHWLGATQSQNWTLTMLPWLNLEL